ncbi:MAG: hypothetical protein VX290_10140 [Candidatus Latescibacterota bacterium]|nr:hypothetical protein [Candidatus Latescibacterota bacterium]
MITTRVRDILNEIEERGSDLNVCPAEDVFGPGGGVLHHPRNASESQTPRMDGRAFSKARNTRRQRRYANVWGQLSVCTPGFVVDGQEWRG